MTAKQFISTLLVVAVLFSIQTEAIKIETKSGDDEADLWAALGKADVGDDKEYSVEQLI